MPKFLASEDYDRDAYVEVVLEHLQQRGLDHLRVRRHADVLVIESGPKKNAYKHARLRRVTKYLWRLEMAKPRGGWEPTPFRGPLNELLPMLTDTFGWVVSERV
jgi:hypothetical protein